MKVARERAWAKKCLENARSVLETADDEAVHAQVSAIALAANADTERLRVRSDGIGVRATWVLIARLTWLRVNKDVAEIHPNMSGRVKRRAVPVTVIHPLRRADHVEHVRRDTRGMRAPLGADDDCE